MFQDRSWLADFDTLPSEKQSEVIDFIQFLKTRKPSSFTAQWSFEDTTLSVSQPNKHGSFLEMAKELIGIVDDAPPDLATNPKYMQEFGK